MSIVAFGLLILSLLPAGALAQDGPRVGERVRVRHADGRMFTGPVETVSEEELRLGGPGGPYIMRIQDIEGLERSLGERRNFGRAFTTALGVAVGAGGVMGAVAWNPCADCLIHPRDRSDAFVWGVVAGAVLGFPLAIVVGIAAKSERWESVAGFGPVVLSAVTPPEGGVALRASIPVGH